MFKFNAVAAAAAIVATGMTVASVASASPMRLTPVAAHSRLERQLPIAGDRRVCVIDTISTAVPRQVCMRYSDWLNAGVDPLADRAS